MFLRTLIHRTPFVALLFFGVADLLAQGTVAAPRHGRDGDGSVKVEGELKQWHKVTLSLSGPHGAERDTVLNPFTDYRFTVTFSHESGEPTYRVPGYYAADGNAATTSADSGNIWRAHLAPDKPGKWSYRVDFVTGTDAAVTESGEPLVPYAGRTGEFTILPTDKQGRDFRASGRLTYVRKHYLRFAGSGAYFLKAGADAPETLLAYRDFDDTIALKPTVPLKSWSPHVDDWRPGDPEWKAGKGHGLIGALNYLAGKGVNSFSFLTYNAGGDGDNVWPFVERNEKLRFDCSKLDQWGIVFDHATKLGLFLHFKLQENEMDDKRRDAERIAAEIPEALDGGATGPERKLYLRELIARFGHALALNWNLGEENTQTPEEQRAMAQYIADTDPYDHLIVIHSFPQHQNTVYPPLLGTQSLLTGASVQNDWDVAHARTLHWRTESAAAGKPWVVCNDEQGPASLGVPPDPGYKGFDGLAKEREHRYDLHDIRKFTLWGTLLAGGAGVEYYFGYRLPENDLVCEDFRSRERSWNYCRIALDFFRHEKIPFAEMTNADGLVGNAQHDNSRYCFAKAGEIYLVYLPNGGTAELDLSGVTGSFDLSWFDPREGGEVRSEGGKMAGEKIPLNAPSTDDWLAVLQKN